MLKKFTISLLVVLGILALIAGVTWRLLGNETYLKAQAGKAVFVLTGRELIIEGPLQLQLGALTTVEASDVSLSNAPWAAGDDMLKVGRLLVILDLRSLFSDQVDILEIELEGVNLGLARNEQGEANWDIFPESGVEMKMAQSPVRIRHLQLIDFSLTHETPTREIPLEAQLENVLFDRQESGKFDLAISGTVNGQPLQLDGTAGPVSSLLTGGPFSQELELNLGDIVLDIQGSMDEVSTGAGVFLDVNFTGPEFGRVTEYLDLPDFSSGPFDFNLLINTEGDMTGITLQGDLGTLDIVANGEVDKLLEPTEAQLQLQVTGPNLQAMGETFGMPALPAVPYRVNLDSELVTGRSTINSLVIEIESDRVDISGELGARPDFHNSGLKFEISGSELSRWGRILGVERFAPAPFSLNGVLSSDHIGALATTAALQFGANHLRIEGLLGTLPSFNGANLVATLKSSDPGSIAVWPDSIDIPAVPVIIQGRIGNSEQGLTLSNVLFEMEGNEAHIDGLISLADDFQGSRLQSDIDIPSVAALGRIFGIQGLPDQPLQATGSVQPSGEGIEFEIEDGSLGDINLSLHGNLPDRGSLQAIEAQVNIVLPSLRKASFLVGDIDLPDLPIRSEGMVRRGGDLIRLSDVVIDVGQTAFLIDAELATADGLAGSTINFSAQGNDLSRIVPLAKLQSLPQDFTARGQWVIGQKVDAINDFELTLGSIKLNIDGIVDDLLHPAQLKLGFLVGGPDISLLNELLGQSFKAEAFSLSTGFEGSLEAFRLEKLHAQLGQSDLAGDLQVMLGDSPGLSGELNSGFLDVSQFRKETTEPEETGQAVEPEPDSSLLFPDTPLFGIDENILNFDLDLDLDLTIGTLDLGNYPLKAVRLGVFQNEKTFRLEPLELKGVDGGSIKGMIQVDGARTVPKLVAKLEGRGFRIGLAVAEDQPVDTLPPSDISLEVRGSGTTYRQMASSLNGHVRFYQGPGQIADAGLDFIFSDLISELFSALNPFAKSSPYTNLECSVIVADIVSGKVVVEPAILQTEQITILSQGVIDLSTEKIDFTFNTRVRKGIGISAGMVVNPLLKLGGLLSSPAIELDPKSAAIKGGEAIATGGLSLLFRSFADRYLKDPNPCLKAIEETRQRDAALH